MMRTHSSVAVANVSEFKLSHRDVLVFLDWSDRIGPSVLDIYRQVAICNQHPSCDNAPHNSIASSEYQGEGYKKC